jgi:hypothetical protein
MLLTILLKIQYDVEMNSVVDEEEEEACYSDLFKIAGLSESSEHMFLYKIHQKRAIYQESSRKRKFYRQKCVSSFNILENGTWGTAV